MGTIAADLSGWRLEPWPASRSLTPVIVVMEMTDQLMRNRAKAIRLIGIANELLAMARELEMGQPLATEFAGLEEARGSARGATSHDHPIWVEHARQTYEDRRRRSKIFLADALFGEPAWDILLDLFIAAKVDTIGQAHEGKRRPASTDNRAVSGLSLPWSAAGESIRCGVSLWYSARCRWSPD